MFSPNSCFCELGSVPHGRSQSFLNVEQVSESEGCIAFFFYISSKYICFLELIVSEEMLVLHRKFVLSEWSQVLSLCRDVKGGIYKLNFD